MPKPTASSERHLCTDFILEPAVKVSQHWLSEGDTDYHLLAEVNCTQQEKVTISLKLL